MEEICVSALTVTGIPVSGTSSPVTFPSKEPSSGKSNVVFFHLKLCNGIELKQENANLNRIICLLQSLCGLR